MPPPFPPPPLLLEVDVLELDLDVEDFDWAVIVDRSDDGEFGVTAALRIT